MTYYFYGDDEEQLEKDRIRLMTGCVHITIGCWAVAFLLMFGIVYLAMVSFS